MNHEDATVRVARHRMVSEQLQARGITNQRVLAAMATVPRHRFIESAFGDRAYGDHALPIGERQTISQPYMVALMTEALDLRGSERVLEVGTGSGYQAAVLAELTARVYSVERIAVLAERARAVLDGLKQYRVIIKLFDGTFGWPEEAPFDAIMVTAGAPSVPEPLVAQLKDGGRLVVPIGDRSTQQLYRVVKTAGTTHLTALAECAFVPLIGNYGWKASRERTAAPPRGDLR